VSKWWWRGKSTNK